MDNYTRSDEATSEMSVNAWLLLKQINAAVLREQRGSGEETI